MDMTRERRKRGEENGNTNKCSKLCILTHPDPVGLQDILRAMFSFLELLEMPLSTTFNRPQHFNKTSLQRFLNIPMHPLSPARMSLAGKKEHFSSAVEVQRRSGACALPYIT